MRELFTRIPIKKNCIGGFMDLPRGTICLTDEDFIYYENKPVCKFNSETGKKFCENDAEIVKCKDLLDELLPQDPPIEKDTVDDFWKNYGEWCGLWGWKWEPKILDMNSSELQELLDHIKEGREQT